MHYYPIVEKKQCQREGRECRSLPLFYMADHSVLGFRVSDCRQAVRLLDTHAFALKHDDRGTEVALDTWSRMKDVVDLLTGNGVPCEIADIAEGIYQG